jgi:hypothetical protein
MTASTKKKVWSNSLKGFLYGNNKDIIMPKIVLNDTTTFQAHTKFFHWMDVTEIDMR